jgi:hypothetical protein
MTITTFAIVVNPEVPAHSLNEFVAYAKANAGKVSYGSAGAGTLNHLTGESLKLAAELPDLTHVPYRGAGPALTDLMGGQIPMIVPAMRRQVLEFHRAGKLRILAVVSPARLAGTPELPTAVEQGFRLTAYRTARSSGDTGIDHRAGCTAHPHGARRPRVSADADRRRRRTRPRFNPRNVPARPSRGHFSLDANHRGDRTEDRLSVSLCGVRLLLCQEPIGATGVFLIPPLPTAMEDAYSQGRPPRSRRSWYAP